jgi:ABC-type transport system involved in cytochrome c biogenesis permease subunit
MDSFSRFFPWMVVALATLILLVKALPQSEPSDQMQLSEFAKIPVVDGGRVKPMASVARETLLIISNRQDYTDAKGEAQPAIKWLLDTMLANQIFHREQAQTYEVFRIDNDQVRSFFHLKAKPGSFRYSLNELTPHYEEFQDQAERSRSKPKDQRDLFDVKVLELHGHLGMFIQLAEIQTPLMVPPASENEKWQPLLLAIEDARDSGRDAPDAKSLASVLLAYSQNDVKAFNSEVQTYRVRMAEQMPEESWKATLETFFDEFQPFLICIYFYVLVFLLACLSWVGWTQPLNRAAFLLAILTFSVHVCALLTRMYLQGRPPVTNLYSSAVFIGAGCLLLALILEGIYPIGVGNAVGGILGATTMLVAHHLGGSGDTMEMMEPVLDTNFWLTFHVLCVTFGYTATFVTGFIGMAFIFLAVATPKLDREHYSIIGKMMYGILCFATLLSFTGTVLGGIWADQSWGRFWGWDPKENGAVLIVIWNALILHARWSGLIKNRGLANLTIIGNMITGWSWFGTNQLGVGLHAYGFNNQLARGLLVFWIIEGVFLIAGLSPRHWWRSSFAGVPSPPPTRSRVPDRRALETPRSRVSTHIRSS